ncbi:MAG: hypothetical protein MR893_07515 [Prevotellaceae bacterium]|nr:hypothetical protein [Prevotellaceae bacterium]
MAKKEKYSTVNYPNPDGKRGHCPRRNKWGNLYDENIYDENHHRFNDNGSALYDSEDDHDSYYESGGYD